MNPVESTVVAATRAYGDIVREIRPLDLTRVPAAARPRAGARRHRLRSWLVPATAAAAVIALAIALVIVRDLPNGRVVPALPSATGSGVPPYYVAVTGPTGWYAYAPLASSPPAVLAIGETLTGKRLATITPPRGSRFVGVTGAADDRTWVVSTMHTSLRASPALSVTWYLLRFTPGAGYTLSKLAIPDMRSWDVRSIGLSGSGRELAMTLVPAKRAAGTPGFELRIYSVATGKLLREWSTNDTSVYPADRTVPGLQDHALTWADGDRVLVFPTWVGKTGTVLSGHESERRIDVTAGSGDLIADSRVIWSLPPSAGVGAADRCLPVGARVTADGKTFLCPTGAIPSGTRGHGRVTLSWLAYSTSAPNVGRVVYKVTVDAPSSHVILSGILWADASGGTLMVEWSLASSILPSTVHYSVVSHGRSRPLPPVPGFLDALPNVAW